MGSNASVVADEQLSLSNSQIDHDLLRSMAQISLSDLSVAEVMDIISFDDNIPSMLTDENIRWPQLFSQINIAISSHFGRVALHRARETTVSIRTHTTMSQNASTPGTPINNAIATRITTPNGTTHSIEVEQNNVSAYAPKPIKRNQKRLSQKEMDKWNRYPDPYKEVRATLTLDSFEKGLKARKPLRGLFGQHSAQQLAPGIRRAEYLHLQAHSAGGEESLDNIVIGSWAANSMMIIYEKIAKELLFNNICQSLELIVTVKLRPHHLGGYTHIAEEIDMQIVTDKGFHISFSTISDNELCKRKDATYFSQLYSNLVNKIQPPVPDAPRKRPRDDDDEETQSRKRPFSKNKVQRRLFFDENSLSNDVTDVTMDCAESLPHDVPASPRQNLFPKNNGASFFAAKNRAHTDAVRPHYTKIPCEVS